MWSGSTLLQPEFVAVNTVPLGDWSKSGYAPKDFAVVYVYHLRQAHTLALSSVREINPNGCVHMCTAPLWLVQMAGSLLAVATAMAGLHLVFHLWPIDRHLRFLRALRFRIFRIPEEMDA